MQGIQLCAAMPGANFLYRFNFFYFMCINICAHLCARPTHEPGAGRRQRKMSDLLELVLQTVVNFHVCAELSQVFFKSSQGSESLSHVSNL